MSDVITKITIRKNTDDTYYLFFGYADGNSVEFPRCTIENLILFAKSFKFDPLCGGKYE